jgi:hypothetical protein
MVHLERHHHRPLLGSGLRGFLVDGELKVGEAVVV